MNLTKPLFYIFCIALLLAGGCQAPSLTVRKPLQDNGLFHLYFEPFPQEAERLSFRIKSISAVTSDGDHYPLSLSMSEISCKAMKTQRLLGSAELPPGIYAGFIFKVTDARLQNEEEQASLLVSEEGVMIPAPFSVAQRQGSVVSLSMRYSESVKEGFSFFPSFAGSTSGKSIPGLVGYVTNELDNTITVFDKQAMRVTGVIPTGRAPKGIVCDLARKRAYVAVSGDDTVEVIDIATGEIINRIHLSRGDAPQELALSLDGKTLLSVNAGSATVSVIDPVSFFESGRITVADQPSSIVLDRGGARAYVLSSFTATISVIDLPRRALITNISVDATPSRAQLDQSGKLLYVTQETGSYLTAIDTSSISVARRHFISMGMNALKVDRATNFLYAGKRGEDRILIYDPLSFVAVDAVATGGDVSYLTIDGEGNRLLAVDPTAKQLLMINLVTRKVISAIDVGEGAYAVSVMGES